MTHAATHLEAIVCDVRLRLAERRATTSARELERRVRPDPARRRRFLEALRKGAPALIAECKRRSPSRGTFTDADKDWRARAQAYARGGAAALSVLTERDHFGGALEHLDQAREAGLPLLRKDFVIDTSMVHEAWLHGADAVLLLPSILDPAGLKQLFECASACGLASLIEVHDERELDLALSLAPDVIGVNARDLATFEVDLTRVERLLPLIPDPIVRVAESGIHGPSELRRVRDAGAQAALVGETLMRSSDPAATLRAWREALDG
ncbi:MAG TPA: indole-3-glycerol phosphate synthase TrpC [Planctomycetota bacterium]|nr:indole-3-glycerol phosphate synthase TrpC [Planctomycetota bacterium]